MNAPDWVVNIREQFPILRREVRGKPLVYLDNAATTLKPKAVLDAVLDHYANGASNIHRGVHFLSEEATRLYEDARTTVREFLGDKAHSGEVVFTSGTTSAINLVARSLGPRVLKPGDEILITHMEHHANIVPWQMLCETTGARLRVVPVTDAGELDMAALQSLLSSRTKIVSFVHVSNALGTINPAAQLTALAKAQGAIVLIDGAQAVAHMPVDVHALGCDFYVFSGHKLFATSGVGALWGRKKLLESMPPVIGGGDMIRSVTFEKTTYADPPARFEGGTPAIGGAIGLAAAIRFVTEIGHGRIAEWESELLAYATRVLSGIPELRIIGSARAKAAILSFVVGDIHPHDMGTLLDSAGIAVRAGHHCTQPLMARYSVPATTRASLQFYNTKQDVDRLAAAIVRAREIFA